MKLTGDLANPKAVWSVPLNGMARYLAADCSAGPAVLWVGNGNGPATFSRIADLGDKPGEVRHVGGGVRNGVLVEAGVIALDGQGRLFALDDGRRKRIRTNDDGLLL